MKKLVIIISCFGYESRDNRLLEWPGVYQLILMPRDPSKTDELPKINLQKI